MWRKMAISYDAEFYAWQDAGKGKPPLALYNIIKPGHPYHGSTVSINTLNKLGLTYLPPPLGN